MSLNDIRQEVYDFFDKNIRPIILDNKGTKEEIINQCYDATNSFPMKLRWLIKSYDDTIRASVFISGYNYLFFMIATPEDKEEFNFGALYHGSRKRKKIDINSNKGEKSCGNS